MQTSPCARQIKVIMTLSLSPVCLSLLSYREDWCTNKDFYALETTSLHLISSPSHHHQQSLSLTLLFIYLFFKAKLPTPNAGKKKKKNAPNDPPSGTLHQHFIVSSSTSKWDYTITPTRQFSTPRLPRVSDSWPVLEDHLTPSCPPPHPCCQLLGQCPRSEVHDLQFWLSYLQHFLD